MRIFFVIWKINFFKRQKTALKTVGILVLISVLALGINAILIKAFPEKFGREEQLQEVDIQEEKAFL